MRSILLVGEHSTTLAPLLESNGFRVYSASTARSGLRTLRREKLQALIVDANLVDSEGGSLLRVAASERPGMPSIVLCDGADVRLAVEVMRQGARDVLVRPLEEAEVLEVVQRHLRAAEGRGDVAPPARKAWAEMERLGIGGCSNAMLQLFTTLKRIAPYQSSVLVVGESGTGKELIARALHALGPRSQGPFVPVNCAMLSEEILENELFGHERGAFTSADRAKQGVMEMADRGTLFLDEIGGMGLGCQAKVLRALERREFRRVGGTVKIKVDLNIIAACNVDLDAMVVAKSFRPDLYFRLKVVTLEVPPLRVRTEAIPVLAARFLKETATRIGLPAKRLTAQAEAALERHSWPGNVRELRNLMESLTLTNPRQVIDESDLPPSVLQGQVAEVRFAPGVPMERVEREIIRINLRAYPTIKDAARALNIPLRTFHDKLRRHKLKG